MCTFPSLFLSRRRFFFSVRFSFSHLIEGSPFSICRKQFVFLIFFFFIHNILDGQTLYDAISFSRWEAHGSESTQHTQIWWCFIWICSVGCVASLLLMVFDHKLINYGLFWMSVSGLEMFSLFSVFQFQFSYLSNVNVLLCFPSLWHIHAQFGLGQCLVFFSFCFLLLLLVQIYYLLIF